MTESVRGDTQVSLCHLFICIKRGVYMATSIDELQIEINAKASSASQTIDELVNKINKLASSLGSLNSSKVTNANSNLSKVNNTSKQFANNINNVSESANRSTKSFKGLAFYIGKFYATYFMAIRGMKKLWSSIESTADYIEAYNYFNVSLGKIGADWSHQWEQYAEKVGVSSAEEYAESFKTRLSESLGNLSGLKMEIGADGKGILSESGMKNLGLNIQDITQYASQLASVTNSVGQTGETSLAVASSFTKLAGDISSLFNVDYSSVSKNLQSGLIGQSRALYKYGIDITNATLQTYAYNLGLSKSVSEMTQAEKMQLRMLAILDQSKVSWGDLANTINSPSNMIRQFKNNLKETGMVLGQLFIPVLQKVLPVINGVTIAIKRLLTNIAGMLGIEIDLDAFGQGYSDTEDNLEDLAGGYEDAAAAAEEYKNQVLGFDEITKVSEPTDTTASIGATVDTIDLTDEIIAATSQYEIAWKRAFENMDNNAQEWAEKLEKYTKPFQEMIEDIKIGDYFALGNDVSKLVRGIFEFFSKAIAKVDWYKIGNNIGDFLAGLNWPKILESALKLQFNIWQMLANLWFGSFQAAPFETAIITAFAVMKFTGLGSTLAKNLKIGISAAFSNTALARATTTGATNLGYILGEGLLQGLKSPLMLIPAAFVAFMLPAINTTRKYAEKLEAEYAEKTRNRVTEETQALVDEVNQVVDTAISNSENRLKTFENIDVDFSVLENLADKYFELAQKESLTNDEEEKLKLYHDMMISDYPELAEILDDKTISYQDQANAVQEYIDKLKEQAIAEAAMENLKDTYKDLLRLQKQRSDIEDEYFTKQKEYRKAAANLSKLNKEVAEQELKVQEALYSGTQEEYEKANADLIELQNQQLQADEVWRTTSQNYLAIADSYNDLGESIETLEEDVEYYTDAYVDSTSEIGDSTSDMSEDVKTSFSSIVSSAQNAVSNTTKAFSASNFIQSGKNVVSGIANGLSGKTSITSRINSIVNSVTTKFTPSNFTTSGKNILTGLTTGAGDSTKKRTFTDKINSIFNIVSDAFPSSNFVSLGTNILEGLKNGLANNEELNKVTTTVTGCASTVLSTFKNFLGIHSPSKVFEELGEFTIEGYNIGLRDMFADSYSLITSWGTNLQKYAVAEVPDLTYNAPNISSSYDTNYVSQVDITNQEELALLRQQNQLLQALLQKEDVVISPDADGIFKMVQGKANNYTTQTGRPAFIV